MRLPYLLNSTTPFEAPLPSTKSNHHDEFYLASHCSLKLVMEERKGIERIWKLGEETGKKKEVK
jgi:hypothetical protein